jgi:membrane-associated phospholipid phosphatase
MMWPGLQAWVRVTALGDSAVTLPCIGLIALWLLLSALTRGLVWRWLLLVAGMSAAVAISKLAFMVWGMSLPGLDFTGLSGHAAMAALVWPALLGLLAGRGGRAWRLCGALLGALLAAAVAWSRVALHAHSVSEAVLGYALGIAFALWLLWRHGREWRLAWSPLLALLPLLLVLPFVYGRHFPTQDILVTIARHMADGPLHTRQELHRH